jgi:hypothetical protein
MTGRVAGGLEQLGHSESLCTLLESASARFYHVRLFGCSQRHSFEQLSTLFRTWTTMAIWPRCLADCFPWFRVGTAHELRCGTWAMCMRWVPPTPPPPHLEASLVVVRLGRHGHTGHFLPRRCHVHIRSDNFCKARTLKKRSGLGFAPGPWSSIAHR